jgi:hypothetical protein
MMAKILSLEAILAADDRQARPLEVPEWGGTIKIAPLTKGQQISMRQACRTADGDLDTDNIEMYLFIFGIAEPQLGEPDIEVPKAKNAKVIDRIVEAIMALGGTTKDGATSAAAVTDAEEAFRKG